MTTTALVIDGVQVGEHARPQSAEELAQALADATARGLAVAPLGGGTQLDIGAPPTRLDLALETTALDRVVEYEPADLTVTVEAGMRFDALQALLAEQGQCLALDPPAQPGATLGGLIATNSSGPLRFAFGTPRDLVIGTRVANADGTLTRAGGRVVKNVAGYDLNKLYIGSLGTLGVLTEFSFKLAPIPPAFATIVGTFSDHAALKGALSAVVRSSLSPLALELIGPRLAARLQLPSAWSLVMRVGGYPQAVERQQRDLAALIKHYGGGAPDASPTVWEDLAAVRGEAMRGEVVVKAGVPLAESSAAAALLEQHLTEFEPLVWSHAGNGVAFASCSAGADAATLSNLRRQVVAIGGNASVVVQRCPTALKREIDVWGDVGSSLGLMRALKSQLDPHNTLNPGRYVGGI
jgi:glycolate oxidase FAD binding subunit